MPCLKKICISLADLFGCIGCYKCVDHTADIPVEKRIERIKRKTYPVVGDAILRIVVRAYFFAAVAAADLGAPRFRYPVVLLAQLHIVQLGAKQLQCLVLVFELGAFLLALNNDTCRLVRYSYRGFRFVDVLTAGTA